MREPSATPVKIVVTYKTEVPRDQQQTLDLNVFLASSVLLNMQSSERRQRMDSIMTKTFGLLASAGVRRGVVREFEVTPGLESVWLDQCGEAVPKDVSTQEPLFSRRDLLEQGATAPPGVNVFLGPHLVDPGYLTSGTSALPGEVLRNDTEPDGILVAYRDEDDGVAMTIAHELGHYLGLSHVIEADGTSQDTVPDTPKALPEAQGN